MTEDEGDDVESSEDEDETCLTGQSKNSSQKIKSYDRVSTCPYPYVNEEKTRIGITIEKEEKPNEDLSLCLMYFKQFRKKKSSFFLL